MKKILIAGLPDKTKNYEKALSHLGVSFTTSLHVPVITAYDGLLLPGGSDIDPGLFGQLNQGSRIIEPKLDRLQLAILKGFIQDRKPVLGICKGLQLINIFFGGNITQHIATYTEHQYCGHDQVHLTHALPHTFLAQLYGTSFTVNSAHHQAADLKGQGIKYIQFAQDNTVEALMHDYLPVIGVQWHPERMCFENKRTDTADGSILLKHFIGMTE